MSFVVSEAMPWHEGEEKMHRLTKVGNFDSPKTPFLQPRAVSMVQRFPLLALGTLDKQGRPWATVWGGEAPLGQAVAKNILGIRTVVDSKTDPVVEALFDGRDDGEVVHEKGAGRMISGLSIHLEQRNRMKLYGRMVAGALDTHGKDLPGPGSGSVGHVQLVWKIETTLGNCPKYLNCKRVYPSLPEPKLISDSPHLPPEALALLGKADMFFIASSDRDRDMDSNHRGGPPGFVRVMSNAEDGAVLIWPEYSGNNLYETLGNLQTSPRAGLVFPDFDTGNVLYVTGNTEVLIGKDAAAVLPRSNLAVRITLTGARFVEKGLPFKGESLERSPYNPGVRYLPSEKPVVGDERSVMAKLIRNEKLTPTIFRVRFAISDPGAFGPWKPGQYVALSFYDELYMGYSHMRDDDPQSLNDDFLRTFTVSSHHGEGLHGEEFEMTIRNVGTVTSFLMRQNDRTGLEVPLKGFAGDFFIKQTPDTLTPFIAGGIGITPVLSQLQDLDMSRFRLFWTLGLKDIGLVQDTFERFPELPKSTALFLTGTESDLPAAEKRILDKVSASGAQVQKRRLLKDDLADIDADEWYLCTGPALRKSIQEWLPGKKTVFEDFNY